jgi:hypothetical protein
MARRVAWICGACPNTSGAPSGHSMRPRLSVIAALACIRPHQSRCCTLQDCRTPCAVSCLRWPIAHPPGSSMTLSNMRERVQNLIALRSPNPDPAPFARSGLSFVQRVGRDCSELTVRMRWHRGSRTTSSDFPVEDRGPPFASSGAAGNVSDRRHPFEAGLCDDCLLAFWKT